MVTSQVRLDSADQHIIEAAHENCDQEGGGIYDFYARHETPPSSAYSSTQTSPVKKKR